MRKKETQHLQKTQALSDGVKKWGLQKKLIGLQSMKRRFYHISSLGTF